jgi:hypothetical protein
MQEVHTRALRVLDPCWTLIFWMLGSHRRLARLWEKLTLFPYWGSLPHTSHL